MYRIENIKIRENISEHEIIKIICKKNRINEHDITAWKIVKKSIDARNKEDIFLNYTIDLETNKKYKYLKEIKNEEVGIENIVTYTDKKIRPIIIGAGPAGLFCALTFVKSGIKPIIIEQGKKVEYRQKDVEEFRKHGTINPFSNVQFGEGGAGTFSDGKLTTNINNKFTKIIIQEFYNYGAPESILYSSKPHIGTDNLINIIKNIREEIVRLGGEFYFDEKVIDFEIEEETVKAVYTNKRKFDTNIVILAIGHSARDTFYKLHEKNVIMKRKNFAVGLRIEHLQEMINISQYGKITNLKLPPAEYKLAYHGEDGRSCFTFCMCPGGEVIASSSDEGTIVTNGMSRYARDGENANSALLVNINTNDVGEGDNPLKGFEFQEKLEKLAFELGGCNYNAPIQRLEDFINNKKSTFIGKVKPTYLPGVTLSNLNDIFPEYILSTLKDGIKFFNTKINGFADPDAILTGVETRTSSPVTIIRDEKFETNIKGIYPCGEGSGYAGGITTSAVDGLRCAIEICRKI